MLSATLLLVAHCVSVVLASRGDQMPEFTQCVADCVSKGDRSLGALKLLHWDTYSDCDYTCQQAVTTLYEKTGQPMQQYHGKWPFRRILGVQEPASVVFSLMNFWPHYANFMILKSMRNPRGMYMKQYYLLLTVVGMNSWLWSAIFHTRDLFFTERMDYFGALLQMFYTALLAVVRLLRLDRPERRRARHALLVTGAASYFGHVSYMSFVKFNYHYNMMVGVYVGLAQTLLWIAIGVTVFRKTREPSDLIPILFPLLILCGLSFELNDFPPFLRLVDAHSLWHASTVIPTVLSYIWIKKDMLRTTRLAF